MIAAPALEVEAYIEWRSGIATDDPRGRWVATVERIAETGVAPIRLQADGITFTWMCPACGRTAAGQFSDEPVSGWDAPRWTRSGDHDRLTLSPSLGCPGFRDGRCNGHYWLRDGELVPA